MINYYERCNSGDDNNESSQVNQPDDQAFFPTQKTIAPHIAWPPNGTESENGRNGSNSPTSPGPYYSTITSNASRYENVYFSSDFQSYCLNSTDFLIKKKVLKLSLE